MHLINSSTVQLETFTDSEIPKYAILSHRWGKDEVLFTDMLDLGSASRRAGYEKISLSCKQAVSDNLGYVWVDTCCIDKSSSAELSEAINSMYAWYEKAEVCYAYLIDVPDDVDPTKNPDFANSEWFKRGWTLQELIAPQDIILYSRGWKELGNRKLLSHNISTITGIDVDVLTGEQDVRSLSIAKRMSWAANRQTTRPEDIAYCLMGLFDVNMAMLYGEGEKAFIRLQEEIMRYSDDESLFAWACEDSSNPHSLCGLLATSPKMFQYSGHISPYVNWESRPPSAMTSRGLSISLPLFRIPGRVDHFFAALNCPHSEPESFIAIELVHLSEYGDDQYARVDKSSLFHIPRENIEKAQPIYVRQRIVIPKQEDRYVGRYLRIRKIPVSRRLYVPKGREGWKLIGETEPRTFKLRISENGNAQLNAFTVVERGGAQYAILFGSLNSEVAIGFVQPDPATGKRFSSGELYLEYSRNFEPQFWGPNTDMVFEIDLRHVHVRVHINVETRIVQGTKCFIVDVDEEIEEEKKHGGSQELEPHERKSKSLLRNLKGMTFSRSKITKTGHQERDSSSEVEKTCTT